MEYQFLDATVDLGQCSRDHTLFRVPSESVGLEQAIWARWQRGTQRILDGSYWVSKKWALTSAWLTGNSG